MKFRLLSTPTIACLLALSSCTYNDLWSGEKGPSSSIDYMMFGHTSGFCMTCDQIYKLADGNLYGASHLTISDPDATPLSQLPNSSFVLVSSLASKIPKRLLTGSTASINNIGTYFPDVGHYYVEVSQDRKVYRWYIEPGKLPSDLQVFIDSVQGALRQLN